jgi:ubiquinone/menaquinone biosynthesis C-methylase UbiE
MTLHAHHFQNHGNHVCPWWLCWTFDNGIRKLLHNPHAILSPYIKEGDTVVDIGPGMGYFSIPMAEMVGEHGAVTAVDLQPEMLAALRRRAAKKQLAQRITTHTATQASLGVQVRADFVLAFWMIHEVPDRARILAEIRTLIADSGRFLIVEPRMHVSSANFMETVQIAKTLGFVCLAEPRIFLSRACLLGAGSQE